MYTSFFKCERQYDPFKAKEIINPQILTPLKRKKLSGLFVVAVSVH